MFLHSQGQKDYRLEKGERGKEQSIKSSSVKKVSKASVLSHSIEVLETNILSIIQTSIASPPA